MNFISSTNRMITGIIFAITILIIFPIMERFTKSHIGLTLPDNELRYTTNDLYRWVEEYGVDGRRWYVILRFTYDLFFPLAYGSFLFVFIGTFASNITSQVFFLAYLPLLGMVLDFIENIVISIIMIRYPKKTYGIDTIIPWVSYIKRISILLSFLFLLMLGILSLLL